MTDEQKFTIRFVGDEPAENDFFRTHTNIARAIAEAITTNPQLRVIGLLGRWGSGKSTVVKQLEVELEKRVKNPDSVRFFIYDAWLNQNDPQRRAFMESLVKFLISRKSLEPKTWNRELKSLSGGLSRENKSEQHVFSPGAKLLALSLIPFAVLLPSVGPEFFQDAFGETVTRTGVWLRGLLTYAGIIPVLTWLGIIAYRGIEDGHWRFLPPVFSEENRLGTEVLIEKTPDPSSIEFGASFRRLMQAIKNREQRLIIVIDNIDRVSENDALQIWASIRNMFLQNYSDAEDVEHPTVVLPFDEKAIWNLFTDSGDVKQREDITESYLDKTFDARFFVPEPVTSDWRDFLTMQLEHTFGNQISRQNIYWCSRFLADARSDLTALITPRLVNKSVNKIAALYLQWQNEGINTNAISYYVFYKDAIEKIGIRRFVMESTPILAGVERDWQRQIAALHYGVSKEKAAQILIEQPLRDSIAQRDPQTFAELSDVAGFHDILGEVVWEFTQEENETPIAHVANCALLLKPFEERFGEGAFQIWNDLVSSFVRLLPIAQRFADFSEAYPILVSHASLSVHDEIARAATTLMEQQLESTKPSDFTEENLQELVSSSWELEGVSSEFEKIVQLNVDARRLLLILSRLTVLGANVRANATAEKLTLAIQEIADDDLVNDELYRVVECVLDPDMALAVSHAAPDWGQISESLANRLRQPDNVIDREPSIETLLLLASKFESAKAVLTQLFDEGSILARYNEARVEEDDGLMAPLAAYLIFRGLSVESIGGSDWVSFLKGHPEFTNDLLDWLILSTDDILIYTLADAYEKHANLRPLIEAAQGALLTRRTLGRLHTGKVFARLWYYQRTAPYNRRREFLSVLSTYDTFLDALEAAAWGSSLDRLVNDLGNLDAAKHDKAAQILKSMLAKADVSDWESSILSAQGPHSVAFSKALGWNPSLSGKSPLRTALVAQIPRILSDRNRSLRSRWFSHVSLLGQKPQRQVIDSLVQGIFHGGTVPQLDRLLNERRDNVLAGFRRANSPHTITKIIAPLSRNAKGRVWLRDNPKFLRTAISQADIQGKNRFRDLIETLVVSNKADQASFGRFVLENFDI